jgi:sugar phosphate isomerase/epimerase
MSLILLFSTLGCAELSLEETLALAAKHRLPAVELRALAGTVELPAHLAKTYGTPAALAARLAGQPVRIQSLDTSFKLIGGTAADREKLLEFVPWAEALGVPRLRVFDGGFKLDAAELAQAVATLGWWRELRRAQGWRTDLMIETHDSLVTTAAIRRLLAAAPDAAILWDTHHTWKKGGEDPVATWRAIRASVVHMHVKDSVSRPSAKHPFTYVLPGDGEFPIAPLLAVLRAEYAGPVSLEWERLWHPYLPPLDEALAVAVRRGWW